MPPHLQGAATERIEREKPKHPDDLRAAHRAAEISFWNDWARTGVNAADRNQAYADAAIACADLYFARFARDSRQVQ